VNAEEEEVPEAGYDRDRTTIGDADIPTSDLDRLSFPRQREGHEEEEDGQVVLPARIV
jgi:hypothetical protein